jgi:fatty-acyl-CoA synthase
MTVPTPSSNSNLPHCLVEFETVPEGLDFAARGETGLNFFSSRGELQRALGYAEIREKSIALAQRFIRAGFPVGMRLAILAETHPNFPVFFFACQYASLVPVPLPLSLNFDGRESYVQRLRGMLQQAGAKAAVSPVELLGHVRQAAGGLDMIMVGTAEDFYALPGGPCDLRPFGKEDPCYIQFSSGSTTSPRGVLVSQRALIANARGIARHGLQLGPEDRGTSWLPLYHDMGLVGFFLTPTLSQISIDYLETTSFARRPLIWLQIISKHGGTISFSPTFGFELCLRRALNGAADSIDLSRWRVAGIGGEMIRPDVLERFAKTFSPLGFSERAFLPSYGLAESTLAVSFASLDEGVSVDRVDRDKFTETGVAVPAKTNGNGHVAEIRSFVFCGRPIPGHTVEIRDQDDRALPDRCVGKVLVKGPSLTKGYFRNPIATGAVMTDDGWLDTGDLGYMVDGRLVISGRSKDLIIVGGRNIWPQDVEWAIEKLETVRAGDVAAFSVTDPDAGERLVVLLQSRLTDLESRRTLKREVTGVVRKTSGISCEVVLVPTRSFTFTSSGKLSRTAVKADFLAGAIGEFDTDDALPPLSATAYQGRQVAAK